MAKTWHLLIEVLIEMKNDYKKIFEEGDFVSLGEGNQGMKIPKKTRREEVLLFLGLFHLELVFCKIPRLSSSFSGLGKDKRGQ